jgi:hypothetical protein
MKLRWYRLLDTLQSFLNKKRKEIREKRKWGDEWEDKTRSGRRYTRVEYNEVGIFREDFVAGKRECGEPTYRIRQEPGWEYSCPNCHEYSLVTESMMPAILEEWRATVARMAAKCQRLGMNMPRIPPEPTAATAGCTNCKFRPGAPE